MFRRGIMAILDDAGFTPESPDDLLAWSHQEHHRVILLTVGSPADWTLLTQLRDQGGDATIVALLPDASVSTYVRAVMSGAAAAVPRNAVPETVKEVFEAAVEGKSLLPVEVVRALTHPPLEADEEDMPSPREIEWLQRLADGATVTQLAERAGYSERAMFRLLRALYTRLGVKGRTEALMQAHERGWL